VFDLTAPCLNGCYILHQHLDGPAQSGFLEQEDVGGHADRGAVVGLLRVVLARGSSGGSASSARVDVGEVDVGVDEAEDKAETTEHDDGDDAAGHPLGHDDGRRRRRPPLNGDSVTGSNVIRH